MRPGEISDVGLNLGPLVSLYQPGPAFGVCRNIPAGEVL